MDEEGDDDFFQEAVYGMNFDHPAVDTDDCGASPDISSVAEQPGFGGSRSSWNNGASICVPSHPGPLSSFRAEVGIPTQADPSQRAAGLGSTDGSQVAIGAL